MNNVSTKSVAPRIKKTFGGASIDYISPAIDPQMPKAMNCVLTFEEALKLHLSLGQALAHLNSYNRSTTKGRRSAVHLCIYTSTPRIAVLEGQTRKGKKAGQTQPTP